MKWFFKLQLIYQPANPLFWLMLALNLLSSALMWIVQNRALNTFGMLLVGVIAMVNAAAGTWFMWRLMQTKSTSANLPK